MAFQSKQQFAFYMILATCFSLLFSVATAMTGWLWILGLSVTGVALQLAGFISHTLCPPSI